jgi:hypothetical protein
MKFVAVVLMAFVAMATGAPATDNELDEIQLPGLFGSLGGKLAAADDMYDYSSSSSSSSSSEEEGDELGDAPEDKACCFPNVWQGRLDSEFGFAPIGDGRHGDDDDSSDSDDGNDDKRRGGHGRPKGVRSIDMVYVDGSKKRLAGRKTEFRGPGKSMNVSYILLTGSNIRPISTCSTRPPRSACTASSAEPSGVSIASRRTPQCAVAIRSARLAAVSASSRGRSPSAADTNRGRTTAPWI